MIYLATPYSFNPRQGFLIAAKSAVFFHLRGNHIFSPILHWHHAATAAGLPADAAFWRGYNEHMLNKAAALWVVEHPETPRSAGVAAEIAYWRKHRTRAVRHWSWEEIDNADH